MPKIIGLTGCWMPTLPLITMLTNTPFFASYGHHPRTGAEPPKPSTIRNPMLEAADKLVDRTEAIRQWLQDDWMRHAGRSKNMSGKRINIELLILNIDSGI